ncbi:MAG: hypothetical protein R3300_17605 [Candidatus Promineifilaceae bacterium]|nr:hypothetical protein [Candidatus Promineifilaceae bacterium]
MPIVRLPWPIDWTAEFGRAAPLLVEVGFGEGRFLDYLAETRPEANLLGVEISAPSLRKAQRRLMGERHVRLLRTSGQAALWALCRPQSVAGLYINFPDPWPKAAHAHRRLINERFLQLAASRLVAGGHLDIATDHDDYADWITECLTQSVHFESRLRLPHARVDTERPQTKYQRKALAVGKQCYYFKWRRNTLATRNSFPIPTEQPMPHVILAPAPDLKAVRDSFTPRTYREQDTAIRFIDVYKSAQQPMVLFDSYIGEEPVDQRILLALTRRDAGDALVHLAEVGHPRVTEGVHLAVGYLVSWLLTVRPEITVERHNLGAIGARQIGRFDEK